MNFLGIGPGELLVILILAFLIFGPERLPEIARGLGKALREFRQMSQGMMANVSELRDELEGASESVASSLMEVKQELEETSRELTTGLQEMVQSVDQAAEEVREVASLEVDLDKLAQPSETPKAELLPSGQSSEVSDEPTPEPPPPSTPAELGVAEIEEEMPPTEEAAIAETEEEAPPPEEPQTAEVAGETPPSEELEAAEVEEEMPPPEATIQEHEG